MNREAKLYGAMPHGHMEEEQMIAHEYAEEQLDEDVLDHAEYFDYDRLWDGEEIIQEPSTGRVIMRDEQQIQIDEYREDVMDEYAFSNEEEFKTYLANAGNSEMLDDGYLDERAGSSHEEEDPFEYNEAPTGRRQATVHNCEVCGVFLKHPSKIAAHMRTHTGERPFQCDICGRGFTQRTPWRMHMKRHAQDLPFACSFGCGKSFPNAAQRNAHDLRHQGHPRAGKPRPHLKPPKKRMNITTSVDDFYQALSDHQRGPPVVEVPLFEDIEPVRPPLSAAAHKRIDEVINAVAENRPVRLYTTKVVDPSSSSSRRLRSRRAPPIVAQCQICGLMLKHPSKIQAHMRSHSGIKPFKCQKCGLSVATQYALRIHNIRKHEEGDRPLSCQWECGRRFASASARNEHERIVHKGVKRYFCSVGDCRRFFSRRTHLIGHRTKDHPGLVHVDEFDDAVDFDYEADEFNRLEEERGEGEMEGMEGEMIDDETDEHVIVEEIVEEVEEDAREECKIMPKGDEFAEDAKTSTLTHCEEECDSPRPTRSTRRNISQDSKYSDQVAIPILVPRSLPRTTMKIARIVRPRGSGNLRE